MQEYIVNKHIKLKLENEKTNIYIDGELFRHCKFLLLFLTEEIFSHSEETGSIDMLSEHLDFTLDPNKAWVEPEKQEILDKIKPETEFWAHCSVRHEAE